MVDVYAKLFEAKQKKFYKKDLKLEVQSILYNIRKKQKLVIIVIQTAQLDDHQRKRFKTISESQKNE